MGISCPVNIIYLFSILHRVAITTRPMGTDPFYPLPQHLHTRGHCLRGHHLCRWVPCIPKYPRGSGDGGDRVTLRPVTCHLSTPGAGHCTWGTWSPCSRSCGTGLASREGSCPCPFLGPPGALCNASTGDGARAHREVQACYLRPCPGRGSAQVWGSGAIPTPHPLLCHS